jgi:sigma-B regulation protein RsbU (phosphoserine phosphatase)
VVSGPTTPGPEARYRLLVGLSRRISSTLDLQELLDHLLDVVRSAVGYDAAGVFVLNRSVRLGGDTGGNLIAGMAAVGFPPDRGEDDPMLRSGKGIVGHVIHSGERVVAPDVTRDPRYVVGRPSTRSEIAVPIISNGEVIGALNLESDRLGAYTEADAELLESFAAAAAIAIEKATLHRQVLEKQRMDQQLRLARHVQTSLLPSRAPALEGYDIDGLNLPTWEIGGDYFDYVPLEDGRLGLVIADVSGKGVPAALLMATFRAALRTAVRRERRVPAIVRHVEQILLESMDGARFVTALYGVLEPRTGRFTYANCGHNPPLLLRARGGRAVLDRGRPALGIGAGARFDRAATITVAPGDTLVLYTDGVIELNNPDLVEFGEVRLEGVLRAAAGRSAADTIGAVVDATRAHAGQVSYEDDFTLVVVRRTG